MPIAAGAAPSRTARSWVSSALIRALHSPSGEALCLPTGKASVLRDRGDSIPGEPSPPTWGRGRWLRPFPPQLSAIASCGLLRIYPYRLKL